jgi:GNAT superfamily N-acetyltransferase
MLPRALRHFRRAGVIGWLPFDEPLPWPEATPDYHLAISSATPGDIASADSPYGVTIRRLGAVDWAAWVDVLVDALGVDDPEERLRWADPAPHLLAARDVHVVVAEEAGGGIAVGSLHVYKRVGLLRAGMVRESERGRGLQRALIAARARLAIELGCDVVTAQAAPESVSDRNLLAMGMRRVVVRPVYRSDAAPT